MHACMRVCVCERACVRVRVCVNVSEVIRYAFVFCLLQVWWGSFSRIVYSIEDLSDNWNHPYCWSQHDFF